jgi:secondary thiamine-phosphate synthase enzyme
MHVLSIKTIKLKEIIDITEQINHEITRQGVTRGFCMVFVKHTTAALATADLDPGTDQDMIDAFGALIPKLNYRHPHDPTHVSDHILSSLIGTSLFLPIKGGALDLGKWQHVVFIELNGPRDREVVVGFVSS